MIFEKDVPDDVASLIMTFNDIIAKVNSGEIPCLPGTGCTHCFGSGFREVPDPQGSHYRGVVRCDKCKYWEYRREREGY